MGIIDTHAHYDAHQYKSDRDSTLKSIFSNGVDKILTCGTNFDDCEKVLALCDKYDGLYAAVGVFPQETAKYEWDENRLMRLAKHKKVVAIGEIGLDYHYDDSPRDVQLFWLEKQILLANKLNLPITYHDREAHNDTLNILKRLKPKGCVHCFSGSVEIARETLKIGMHIGVGGVVTFKNARVLKEVVESVPLERILLETDAPYMAPEPYRGRRNRSDYIKYVAQKIAEIKNITPDEVINTTTESAEDLFGFDKIDGRTE